MGVIGDSGLLARPRAAHETWITDGDSETWVIHDVIDGAGNPFNYAALSTTECKVLTKPGGDVVVTPTCTWSTVSGRSRLTITLDDSLTTGLITPGQTRRDCYWFLRIKDSADTYHFWRSKDSAFHIEEGD